MIYEFKREHAYLSNFWVADMKVPWFGGTQTRAASVEHAFQAYKAKDPAQAEWVLSAPYPREAKLRGNQVQCRDNWDLIKREVMLRLLLIKFRENSYLLPQLLATADLPHTLVEGNRWGDTYWGAVNIDHPAFDLHKLPTWEAGDIVYTGHNWLGRLLMVVRDVYEPVPG